MAQFDTIRTAAGARAAEIDEGLRAHMNKVYGTMSVGMLITFAAAWAIAGLATTSDPSAAAAQLNADTYLTSLGYSIYASPTALGHHVCTSAVCLRLQRRDQPYVGRRRTAGVLRICCGYGRFDQLDLPCFHR